MLEISAVSKAFKGAPRALEAIDLTVTPGEIVSLVGTSGCGKSTLLRIICGLETATSGRVRIDGHEVAGPPSEVGVVFQEPRLMPWLTVSDNIRFGISNENRKLQDERVKEVLEKIGLTNFAAALPRTLSGGMAQRVAIARALVTHPEILLLDEPFSALDSFTRVSLQEHLLKLWQDLKFTAVLVTHDIEEALALSDRVLVMRGHPGRIHREVHVEEPRPRKRSAASFQALKEEIIASLDLSEAGAA